MVLRANLVKEFSVEYGACLGFNYDREGFSEMLDKCKVVYIRFEDYDQIDCDDLLNVTEGQILALEDCEQKAMKELINGAKNFSYAVKSNWLRVEWF
ncbi:hypothetical protein [Campylobacter showae]|jgi:hypothetical protein|uniref:hypothetical protein n=1 Tax=Campylobacter showae TaxID=204 RepID=UPI000F0845EC|nr:hypothetical protein [Campylobacter showae]